MTNEATNGAAQIKIFLLIPAETPDGPIRGAFAIANSLADRYSVVLVCMKAGTGAAAWLDPRIKKMNLFPVARNFFSKLELYKRFLKDADEKKNVRSLSFCLSADFLNSFCSDYATTLCSIRGNLVENYRMDYGFLGSLLGRLHLRGCRYFDYTIAMTQSMAVQIEKYSGKKPIVIGNFVDEYALGTEKESIRDDCITRYIFVGSLSPRKQVGLLLQSFSKLRERHSRIHLDIVGAGKQLESISRSIKSLNLYKFVTLHGFVPSPYELVSASDVFVLPSLSEGVSRASLEALYLGVVCVLRNADGNEELIQSGKNGVLFDNDSQLVDALESAGELATHLKKGGERAVLIPKAFRQYYCRDEIVKLMELDSGKEA